MAKRKKFKWNWNMFGKLILAIILDIIGYLSYLFPAWGELSDTVWAPIYAIILYYMYDKNIYAGLGWLEEALPFTDFIPSATIFWLIEVFEK